MIQSAYVEDGAFVITGIEQYANGHYENSFNEAKVFKRTIDPNFSECLNLS